MFIRTDDGYLNLDHVTFVEKESENILIFYTNTQTTEVIKKTFKDKRDDLLSFVIYLEQGQFDKLQSF